MEVFRISNQVYASTLSGVGAALKGARWNSVGTELIYTAANRSLAMAEVAVHFSIAMSLPKYKAITIYIPDSLALDTIHPKELPKDWAVFPHAESTKKFGDQFEAQNKYAVLRAPSAVVKGDFNFLINPRHPDFSSIKIVEMEDFRFDGRLIR